jgi:ribulose-5-phosphate 4-epimerase/fuculose-1-phosphate aldolase
VSDDEWRVRVDLAAAYRLAHQRGWTDLIYTHISAAVPGEADTFLINEFGLTFDEVTASNLVKIDQQGRQRDGAPRPVNRGGFAIHAAVHAARSDAACVMHLHNPYAIAVSAMPCGLLPCSQHAMRFHRSLAYHDYEGLALTPPEAARLVECLGGRPAMLLRNHGSLTCGASVALAYTLMDMLDRACAAQVRAMACGQPLVTPPTSVVEATWHALQQDDLPEGEREWPALLRGLDRIDPGFRQ